MASDEITVFKGETKKINATIQNDNGQALDLTNANTIELVVSNRQGLQPNYAAATTEFTISGVNPDANGNVTFDIKPSNTSGLNTGLYAFQIHVEFPNSDYTAVTGDFFIKPDIK